MALPVSEALRAQSLSDPSLSLTTVTTGLSSPTTMAFVAPDDILVLQKANGRVRRVLDGVLQAAPVLDVNVNADSERGLLGIAVNSATPPDVFLFYTEAEDMDGGAPLGNRVYRYAWNPVTGMLEGGTLILDLPADPGPNHDGGILVLGPPAPGGIGDGAPLYVVIGDLNRNGQLENFAAGDPPDDTGVILRVQQDGTAYPGNPFTPYCAETTSQTCSNNGDCPPGEMCRTEVARYWAYGVRNSFGMALDPVTGSLWDTENGPQFYDEVNLAQAGFNSGWEDVMGPAGTPSPPGLWDVPGAGNTYSEPEFSWLDTTAPTAILFPWASDLGAGFDDVALVGDSNSGQIYRLPLNGARDGFDFTAFPALQDLVADDNSERDLLSFGTGFGAVTDLEIGPDQALYIVSLTRGAIYRASGTQAIFADGFESGDTSAWTAVRRGAPDRFAVQTGTVRSGVYAARVTVDKSCTDGDYEVPSGTTTTDPVVTPCGELTANDVDVVSGDVRFRAGEAVGLGEGFKVAAAATLLAETGQTVLGGAWVRDESPQAATLYRVRFAVNPDGLTLPAGEQFDHLVAYDAEGNREFLLGLTYNAALPELRLWAEAYEEGGVARSTQGLCELVLGAGWHLIEARWTASTGTDGDLIVSVDGLAPQSLASCLSLAGGLDNGSGEISAVEWGSRDPSSSSLGDFDLDDFDSRRSLDLGPPPP